MDFLRFLLRLPLLVLRGFYWVISKIVGDVSWSAPRWMRATGSGLHYTGRGMQAHPGRAATTIVALIVVLGGGAYGYHWYKTRPRPVEEIPARFSVQAPTVTDYTTTPIQVYPMVVNFTRSVAPLALTGKTVTTGIAMKPDLAGAWTWTSDRILSFQPKEDWPVGQSFDVQFDAKTAFAEHVKVEKDNFNFRSAEFSGSLVQAEFYQDPQDAIAKKAVVHFGFNHPVDTTSFEKNVSVKLEGTPKDSGKKKFLVTYDERKLNAFVHSEPLSIPKDSATLVVTVDNGVHAARGGPALDKPIDGSVAVPGLYSLQVDNVAPTLVDNAKFEPEQVLVVEMSQAVSDKDSTKSVSAWLLPEFNEKTPVEQRDAPYNWSMGEVGDDILKQSQKLPLEAVATEREFEPLHSFKFHADPDRYVFVRVEKNLHSFGGYVMGKPYATLVQVPQYPRMLKFMADGALLSLNGEKRVSVVGAERAGHGA